jgi:hypothetical protein
MSNRKPVTDSDSRKNHGLIPPKIHSLLRDAVCRLKFGQITLTVHNSRIVQVETTEKTRFPDALYEGGEGI